MYAKLKPIMSSKSAGKKSPHPSQATAELLASRRAYARSRAIAEDTRASIDAFEASMRYTAAAEPASGSEEGLTVTSPRHRGNTTGLSPTAEVVSALDIFLSSECILAFMYLFIL